MSFCGYNLAPFLAVAFLALIFPPFAVYPRADFKPKEELLNVLLGDFRAVLQHELAHGVPKPKKPSLVKPRAAKPGATSLATKLLLRQREKAAAHTRAFWASNPEGAFVAFRKTRTRVPQPKKYIGVKYSKIFENDETHVGTIEEHHDDGQLWSASYADGDQEDLSVKDMKQFLGARFVCGGPPHSSVKTAAELRQRNRNRRATGRENPLDGIGADLADIRAAAHFELPARYKECSGTKYKLLKIYHDEKSGKALGAYCPEDEAAGISSEDIEELSLHELEAPYDVEVADYVSIVAWIDASNATAVVVERTEGLRRSTRNQ